MHEERALPELVAGGADLQSIGLLALLQRDNAEREAAVRLRGSMAKCASAFANVRRTGLQAALRQLLEVSTQSALCRNAHADRSEAADALDVMPYNALCAEVGHGTRAAGHAQACAWQAAHWAPLQRALELTDYTAALFERSLAPRGMGWRQRREETSVRPALTFDEALRWSTLPANNSNTVSPGNSTPNELLEELTAVGFDEQELALRLLQGMCLAGRQQRRFIAYGVFFDLVADSFADHVQHLDALQAAQAESSTSSKMSDAVARARARQTAQVRVLTAMVDVVEAACHYSPVGLTRLVISGALHAMLEVAGRADGAAMLRASVLDTVSLLMQEVAPFQRIGVLLTDPTGANTSTAAAAAAAQTVSAAGGADTEARETLRVLQVLLRHGTHHLSGSNSGSTSGGGGEHGVGYGVDRLSVSRFDAAVRLWFSQRGLNHLLAALLELRGAAEWAAVAAGQPQQQQASRVRAGTTLTMTTVTTSGASTREQQRARQRASQLHERRLAALLQSIDSSTQGEHSVYRQA